MGEDSGGNGINGRGRTVRALLRTVLGEEVFTSWFNAMEFESFDGATLRITFPTKFLKNWVQSHYIDDVLTCCAAEFFGVTGLDIVLRHRRISRVALAHSTSAATVRGSTSTRPT